MRSPPYRGILEGASYVVAATGEDGHESIAAGCGGSSKLMKKAHGRRRQAGSPIPFSDEGGESF